MKISRYPLRGPACLILMSVPALGQLSPEQMDDVGFTSLQARLGAAIPTGAGVSVSQVEAFELGTIYRPDTTVFAGHHFIFPNAGSTTASGHATTVGQHFYGSSSLAPSIGTGTSVITAYDANEWIVGFLRAGGGSQLPQVETNDISNSSWVGNTNDAATDVEVVRRMDFAIQRDDYVAVFGLNNGGGTTVPPLMAGSYNGITVGLSDGNHSSGGTLIEGARTRPDIVVPISTTSMATATVSSASALLIETSRSNAGLSNAEHSELVKSLLMAGATRNEVDFPRAWTHTETQPLDATFGAGELNIDNAHRILTAGEMDASATSVQSSTGWDFATSTSTNSLYYFDVTGDAQLGAALVWNRIITATISGGGSPFDSSLGDLNLRLYSVVGLNLDAEIASSASTVDNVELITARLAAGRYAIEVSSNTTGIDYGLSWQTLSVTSVPEPDLAALALVSSLVVGHRRRRS